MSKSDFTKILRDVVAGRGDHEQRRINDFAKALGVDPKDLGEAGIPDSKKIELQKDMIVKLTARVALLEETVESKSRTIVKLNENNTKIIKKVQELVTRIGKLEDSNG